MLSESNARVRSTTTTATTTTTTATTTRKTTTTTEYSIPWYKNIFDNLAPFHDFENNHIFDFDPEINKTSAATTTSTTSTSSSTESFSNANYNVIGAANDTPQEHFKEENGEKDSSEENLKEESIEDLNEKKMNKNVDSSSSSRFDTVNNETSTGDTNIESSDNDYASNYFDEANSAFNNDDHHMLKPM